jgi:MFS family permease
MVLTQIAMVAIMTMTPVQMRHHDRSLGEVGFVIGMHIGAMYLPSLVTGRLVDRVGRLPMAVAAAVTLLAAGLVAGFSPGDSMPLLTLALVLLGLGWNFGLISGTALIVDSTPVETRARTQGSVDVLIALSGAGGGALSGMVVDASSFAVLSLAGGFLALLLVPVVAWHRTASARPEIAVSSR